MRKHLDKPKTDVQHFVDECDHFFVSKGQKQNTPLTGVRLRIELMKMGIHTSTRLDVWGSCDVLCLHD